MFHMQMVCLEIVEISSGPLLQCFPRKWYALKLSNPQVDHFFNVSMQILCLKIVEPSSYKLFPCFPRKWYVLKLSNPQVAHFFYVSIRKWYTLKLSNPQVAHCFNVSLANGTHENCRTLKWPTLSMYPSQMVRLKILEPSSGPLLQCFPRKWYALKLSNPQVAHFFHVSHAHGTP